MAAAVPVINAVATALSGPAAAAAGKAALTAGAGALASKALAPSAPKMPQVQKPESKQQSVAPIADDPSQQAAAKRQIANRRSTQQTRLNTFLTDDSGGLG